MRQIRHYLDQLYMKILILLKMLCNVLNGRNAELPLLSNAI